MAKVPINIKKSTHQRMGEVAIPFSESEDDVINRALDVLENSDSTPTEIETSNLEGGSPLTEPVLDPFEPIDLRFTKLLGVSIDGKPSIQLRWGKVLQSLLVLAYSNHTDFETIENRCGAHMNLATGQKMARGWSYIEEIDASIQGMSANKTHEAIFSIAREFNFGVSIRFAWRNKREAAYPGQTAWLILPGQVSTS